MLLTMKYYGKCLHVAVPALCLLHLLPWTSKQPPLALEPIPVQHAADHEVLRQGLPGL
jgi:hypothetical protein